MKNIIPQIGKGYTIDTAFDYKNFPKVKSKYQAYFMSERKYFIGDFMRLKFKINPKVPRFDE